MPTGWYGTICCICFGQLENPAIDYTGQKWDVCEGLCAFQAGIDTERFDFSLSSMKWRDFEEWQKARIDQRYL